MRLPDDFRRSVCFLGSEDSRGKVKFRGTAFLVGVLVQGRKDLYHGYLVTAAHSIRKATQSPGGLYGRFNTPNGGSVTKKLTTNWFFPEDEAVDLAVLPLPEDVERESDQGVIPLESFATDRLLEKHNVGIGYEVAAIGLFYFREGVHRNLPVLRTGIVAAMPEEPFEDEVTGRPYDAYLIELRSFGGLSGTPVFAVLYEGSIVNAPPHQFSPLVHRLTLIGLIRGHWDLRAKRADVFEDEVEQANLGLALVTPVQELTKLLWRDDLIAQRAKEALKIPPDETQAT